MSQLSPLSPPRVAHIELSEVERCQYEERAAIKKYDAGLPREQAEAQALEEVLAQRSQWPGASTLPFSTLVLRFDGCLMFPHQAEARGSFPGYLKTRVIRALLHASG